MAKNRIPSTPEPSDNGQEPTAPVVELEPLNLAELRGLLAGLGRIQARQGELRAKQEKIQAQQEALRTQRSLLDERAQRYQLELATIEREWNEMTKEAVENDLARKKFNADLGIDTTKYTVALLDDGTLLLTEK
jgi:hypothetical protein